MGRSAAVVAAMVAAMAGCGSDSGLGTASACSVTITGGLSGTYSCTVAVGSGFQGGTDSGVGITTQSGAALSFAFALNTGSSQIAAGTYSQSSPQKAGTIVTTPSYAIWDQSSHSTDPDAGTYTLTITSLGAGTTGNGGTAYLNAHGTLVGTLVPVTATGASGNLNVSVSF
jgi:hypothetical protein